MNENVIVSPLVSTNRISKWYNSVPTKDQLWPSLEAAVPNARSIERAAEIDGLTDGLRGRVYCITHADLTCVYVDVWTPATPWNKPLGVGK